MWPKSNEYILVTRDLVEIGLPEGEYTKITTTTKIVLVWILLSVSKIDVGFPKMIAK